MPSDILHITNGDGAVGLLRSLLGEVDILPWRDMLHEGPVPASLQRGELSAVRAAYLAGVSGRAFADVLASFRDRDQMIDEIEKRSEVVIWLEHDLYDQLQLLQILDQLPSAMVSDGRIKLAQSDRFLGRMDLEAAKKLETRIRVVTPKQQAQGREIWQAFTAPTPEPLAAMIDTEISELPFMAAAIERLLEELPSIENGLPRTEQQILSVVDNGSISVRHLFRQVQDLEDAQFMGDLSLFGRLDGLAHSALPLIAGTDG